MKTYSFLMQLLVISLLSSSLGLAQKSSSAGFEKLKSLEGEWHGVKSNDGEQVEISYELMSGGSVLVETIKPVNEPSMVTIYHLDGDKLMMTHYCSAGNQPRMIADLSRQGSGKIDFKLLDITNLDSPTAGHMSELTFVFESQDAMKQEWTFTQDGKGMPAEFDLERKN